MFDVDWMGLLGREVLRERAAVLIAEACAWAVGLSDQPQYLRRHGRLLPSGSTLGERAAAGQPLSGDEDGRLDLGDASPGSFQDALNALRADGSLHADRFDDEVLAPFVLDTCLLAAERARRTRGAEWQELVEDLGEDGADLVAVVRAADWEAPLRIEAEHGVLAALARVPLIEVEAEGLPLSMVRAAEAATRGGARAAPATVAPDDRLAGALFLARLALEAAELAVPVLPAEADRLLDALLAQGLEPEEVVAVLPHLPVHEETAEAIGVRIAAAGAAS